MLFECPFNCNPLLDEEEEEEIEEEE